jgi:hypothetical protein
MMLGTHRFLLAFLLAAGLATPATAFAADSGAPFPLARQVTALDGTIVWVTGELGRQTLMRRTPDGAIASVAGSPVARSYGSIDLGRDRDGRLLLTYLRCDAATPCKATDVRADRVAAIAVDVYEYSFPQTIGGRDMGSMLAASSEGS